MVNAKKKIAGKIVTRQFTDQSWKMLGDNKNGWVSIPSEVSNTSNGKKPTLPEAEMKVVAGKAKEDPKETIEELEARLNAMKESLKEDEDKSSTTENTKENEDSPQGEESIETSFEGHSNDDGVTVPDAIMYLKTLTTEADVKGYVEGEERKTILHASIKHIESLEG